VIPPWFGIGHWRCTPIGTPERFAPAPWVATVAESPIHNTRQHLASVPSPSLLVAGPLLGRPAMAGPAETDSDGHTRALLHWWATVCVAARHASGDRNPTLGNERCAAGWLVGNVPSLKQGTVNESRDPSVSQWLYREDWTSGATAWRERGNHVPNENEETASETSMEPDDERDFAARSDWAPGVGHLDAHRSLRRVVGGRRGARRPPSCKEE